MDNHEYYRDHYISLFCYGDEFAPLEIEKSSGSYLYLENGQKILDFTGQLGAVISGNCNKFIQNYVQEAMTKFGFVWEESFTSYKKEVIDLFFNEILSGEQWAQKIRFFVTGSEAVEAATLIAREITGKEIVFTHSFAYHGWTNEATNCSDFPEFGRLINSNGNYKSMPKNNTVCFEYPFCKQCPFGKEYQSCKSLKELYCITDLRKKIEEVGPDKIAAVFSDCTLGLSAIMPPDEYIPQLRKITREYGIYWIDDEIFTGFRMGKWFAYQNYLGVYPDIVCFGKGITNGIMPVSGIIVSKEITEKLNHYRWQICSTFAASPLAMSAIVGNIKYIIDNELLAKTKENETIFFEHIMNLQKKHPCIGDIFGKGLFWGVELIKLEDGKISPILESDRRTVLKKGQSTPLRVLRNICLKKGLLIGGYVPNTIRITPSLTLSREEMDQAFEILDNSLNEFEER